MMSDHGHDETVGHQAVGLEVIARQPVIVAVPISRAASRADRRRVRTPSLSTIMTV